MSLALPRAAAPLATTLVLLLGDAIAARAHVFTEHALTPTADWCARIQYGVSDGDLVHLAPGDYPGPCVVARSGLPEEGEPLALVGAPGARIVAPPGRPALIVTGAYVRLAGLILVGQPDAPVVESRGRTLLVDGCTFLGGATGLAASEAPGGLSLIDNLFEDGAAGIDFSCRDSASVPGTTPCDRTRVVLKGNLFRSRRPGRAPAVALAAAAEMVLEGNVIEGGWPVAVDLDGLGAAPTKVAGNVLTAPAGPTATAIGVSLRGSPAASLINNVLLDTEEAAVALDDTVATLVGNTLRIASGLAVRGAARRVSNAVAAPDLGEEDVDCGPGSLPCWESETDLRPRAWTSPLLGHGPPLGEAGRDLCGAARRDHDAAGALAEAGGTSRTLAPVPLGASACFQADEVASLLVSRPPASSEDEPAGCQGGRSPDWPAWAAALLATWALWRRRPSSA